MLGQKIRMLRNENHLSREDLAEKLGISKQNIILWENNTTTPSLEYTVAIANVFDVSTDMLLKDSITDENTCVGKKTANSKKSALWIIALLACLLSSIILLSVFLIIRNKPNSTLFMHDELSAEEIFNSTAPSTVEIRALSLYDSIIGTGFFIDDTGTVITNYHVIEGCLDANIVLQDGTEHSIMSILGYDENLDVAILSTSCMDSFPVVYREDIVSTGETVYTLGSSLGLTGTFAEGIISSANRRINGNSFIQTTAPISSGNSGGPLVDKNGKVIGITTAAFEEGQNLNLAVPIILAVNINRDSHIGSLKNYFMAQYSEKINPLAMVLVELAIDSYIENPNEETRAYLIQQLDV